MKRRFFRLIVAVLATTAFVAGCSSNDLREKVKYEQTRSLPPLEIPPDLSSLPGQERAPVEPAQQGATTFSEFSNKQQTLSERLKEVHGVVLPDFKNVRVERAGSERWLVVKASPEDVWPRVREFVLQSGMLIEYEDSAAGLIRTNWVDNRAKVGDLTQTWFGKWFGSLYSTGERDMYRIRIARGSEAGTTEVYIVHYGMEEVIASSDTIQVQTRWQRRPADPELEAEMLAKMMVQFGLSIEDAKQKVADVPADSRVKLIEGDDGAVALQVRDDLDKTWGRVRVSLDRLGFMVEQSDRDKGIYYVRYNDVWADQESKSFWSKLFRSKDEAAKQYQVRLSPEDKRTDVQVFSADGVPVTSSAGGQILSALYDQLK